MKDKLDLLDAIDEQLSAWFHVLDRGDELGDISGQISDMHEMTKAIRVRQDALKHALIGCMNSMSEWGDLEDGMPNMKGVEAWDSWQIGKNALSSLEDE